MADKSKRTIRPTSPRSRPRPFYQGSPCLALALMVLVAIWPMTGSVSNSERFSTQKHNATLSPSSPPRKISANGAWILEGGEGGRITLTSHQQQRPDSNQSISLGASTRVWTIQFQSIPSLTAFNVGSNPAKTQAISIHLVDDSNMVDTLMFLVSDREQVDVTLVFKDSSLTMSSLTNLSFHGVGVVFQSQNWLPTSHQLQQLSFDSCSGIDQLQCGPNCSIDALSITNSQLSSFPTAILPSLHHELVMENVILDEPMMLNPFQMQELNDINPRFTKVGPTHTCPKDTTDETLKNGQRVCLTNRSPASPGSDTPDQQQPQPQPQPQTKGSTKSDSSLTTVAIVLGVMVGVVLLVGGFLLARRPARHPKESCYMADTLYTHLLDGIAVETRDKIHSGVPELEISPDEVVVGQKLGTHGLWQAKYLNTEVVMHKVLTDQNSEDAMQDFGSVVISFVNLRHSNVMDFIGLVRFDRTQMGLLVEYMSNGCLRSVLANPEVVLPWKQRLRIAQDLCRGLSFVQSVKTARHFSPNLCAQRVFCDEGYNCKLNLFDFGMPLKENSTPLLSFGIGIMPYRAPEVLLSGQTTEESQIYALGMIFCELSSQVQPYHEMSVEHGWTMAEVQIAQDVARGKLKPNITGDAPKAFQDLTARCLSFDPKDRPSLREISASVAEP